MFRLIVLIILSLTLSTQALAFSKGELACFAKVDAKDFVPRVRPVQKRIRNSKPLGKFSRYVKKARLSRYRLNIFIVKGVSPRCHEGNYGWARRNVCVLPSRDYVEWAVSAAQSFDPIYHWTFVEEVRCLRRTGTKETSFNSTVRYEQ